MKKVHLLGRIGETFGSEWDADCDSISEIFQLIECQVSGFKAYMINCAEENINFSIRAGKDLMEFPEELSLIIHEEDIFITEVPAGASSGGWKLFAAAVIIAAVWFFQPQAGPSATNIFWTQAAGAGAQLTTVGNIVVFLAINLAITGINELLMPSIDKDKGKQGYYFSGPVNTVRQGQPVPLLYGELIVGGAPISVSYSKRPISSSGFVYRSSDTVLGDFDAISDLNPGNLGVV